MANIIDTIYAENRNTPIFTDENSKTLFFGDGGYKLNDATNFVFAGFNMKTALQKAGIRETVEAEFLYDTDDGDVWRKDNVLGISTIFADSPDEKNEWSDIDKHFAINPRAKKWEGVVFHEIGHLILNHGIMTLFEKIFTNRSETFETHADLFSYFSLKALGYDTDVSMIAKSLYQYKTFADVKVSDAEIERIKKLAEDFIASGRAGE